MLKYIQRNKKSHDDRQNNKKMKTVLLYRNEINIYFLLIALPQASVRQPCFRL